MKMCLALLFGVLLFGSRAILLRAEPPVPAFRAVDVDTKIEIGYGVAVADVDGDGKPDILLADKKQFVWYKNPTWQKFVLAENLTKEDNVCIAAADIDGDGKCEIAVGAGWNPGDTVNSGAVFYLIPPKDRTQKWEPVELPHEPTVHRMKWVRNDTGKYDLIVVPLHGRGNKNGEGEGVKILSYKMPSDPKQAWRTVSINDSLHFAFLTNDSLHLTHNFHYFWSGTNMHHPTLLIGAKEGLILLGSSDGNRWTGTELLDAETLGPGFKGVGEVRKGWTPEHKTFFTTVEPMHGNQLVVYHRTFKPKVEWKRNVIDNTLVDGHALACGDLLGIGSDQIVVGWRAMNKTGVKVGIKLFTPLDREGKDWRATLIDDNTMACEDLTLADLNGDGKLDIVAAGRATKNVRIYFNQGGTKGR